MSERTTILVSLVQEVLGPRNGPFEVMPTSQDPRNEFITGVLEPAEAALQVDDIESDIEEVIEETSSEEDQDNQGFAVVPNSFAPALNPKALPRSIGLSFTVQSVDKEPQIEICANWARYLNSDQNGWQRYPASFLTGVTLVTQDREWIAGNGVRLQMRARMLAEHVWRVSLFLVNVTAIEEEERVTTRDCLFQPQIRVHCCPGTELLPVRTESSPSNASLSGSLNSEDASLALLYRERLAFARGHLCGAVWRDIDPERPHPDSTIQVPESAPFMWVDRAVVPQAEWNKFSPADVRTELVPCYSIETPLMDWRDEDSVPVFDPQVLAEIWHPDDIRSSLQPLVDGYRNWVNQQHSQLAALSPSEQNTAASHLAQCEQAADRIEDAIDILVADERVRLAFCFANKAISIQARWSNTIKGRAGTLVWRPFQLAFILLNIPALADPLHPDRSICDLLWFPTGGGKTEAYLGLTAFTLALRRLCTRSCQEGSRIGAGVAVISRYTLRLLTIQQFRRALGLITACEVLRVENINQLSCSVGWRPRNCPDQESFLWGGIRFSIGLWVGGGVTPNNLLSIGPIPRPSGGGMAFFAGALDILQGADRNYDGPNHRLRQNINQSSRHLHIEGEPAQVSTCPCCGTYLAVPDEGLGPGQHTLHFLFQGGAATTPLPPQLIPTGHQIGIDTATITPNLTANYRTLSLTFTITGSNNLEARQVDQWWYQTIASALGPNVVLLSARPARPGYFILSYINTQHNTIPCGFELYCPDPRCELNSHLWAEQVPLARGSQNGAATGTGQMSLGIMATSQTAELPLVQGLQWQIVPEWLRHDSLAHIAGRTPIPAATVDDQIYHQCPSLVIATVDKFARLAFEPKASSLFGNVDHYHSRWGYYRAGSPPSWDGNLPQNPQPHPPGLGRNRPLHIAVPAFQPPDLILQDELHLIEGPLGSMVGLYETSLDHLCARQFDGQTVRAKYVASTATIRQAEAQIQSLFNRQLALFPPSAISADDRFFARSRERDVHPLDSQRSGRLYAAVCAPGKGAQTPIVRIWSSLLQAGWERWQASPTDEVDRFYTLVGYFNAIRELAGALSLYRQDVPDRMRFRSGNTTRQLEPRNYVELSSRASSLDLPILLSQLEQVRAPQAPDVLLATSMFGTGVDVDRLGLMVVHGQPKTTASYIQATGRVGRQTGSLVVTFFRASRPRDLDHYEFFTGYHRALYRYVEPVTVAPFSPRARERALGPLAVVLLRQGISGNPSPVPWAVQQRLSGAYFAEALRMGPYRHSIDVSSIPTVLENRAVQQPLGRRPQPGETAQEVASELDRWAAIANLHPDNDRFVYSEPSMFRTPIRHVVLGDAQHRFQGLSEAFENAPQSLRDVEESTGFKT